MKRVWGHVLAGLTLLAGGGAVVSACAHDDSTLFVRDVLAPQFVANGNACVYTDQPTQTFISAGTLDLAIRTEYRPVDLVGNQMVPRGDPNSPMTETSYVTIDHAVVRVTESASGQQISTFTSRTSATVAPSSGTTPSYIATFVTTLDPATLADARIMSVVQSGGVKKLVTFIRFFGKSLGGQAVESDEFAFPVDVCSSEFGPCLVRFTSNCLGGTGGSSQSQAIPCSPGQDFSIDCCSVFSICQALPTVPSGLLDGGGG
jgi:hypothetical protein